jgi:hypothetical protein
VITRALKMVILPALCILPFALIPSLTITDVASASVSNCGAYATGGPVLSAYGIQVDASCGSGSGNNLQNVCAEFWTGSEWIIGENGSNGQFTACNNDQVGNTIYAWEDAEPSHYYRIYIEYDNTWLAGPSTYIS